eukprot:5585107-Pyramimonas_sp.AAC.1
MCGILYTRLLLYFPIRALLLLYTPCLENPGPRPPAEIDLALPPNPYDPLAATTPSDASIGLPNQIGLT